MAECVLEVEQLRYRYDDGTRALFGVDLMVDRGEKVGLIGANGSGKSTLLMCLAGLFHGEGTIRVEGSELTRRTTRSLRGQIGLVFQSPDDQLFMPTLADDLAFGPINQGLAPEMVDRRVEDVAEQMNLSPLLDRPPHHLSMGQKRNAAIATVLAMEPALLLMDEPSSNLDPRSRRRVIELLAELDTAMLIASHDMDMIGRLCTRVVLIDAGKVATVGPTAKLLADAELMARHGLEVWHRPAEPIQ